MKKQLYSMLTLLLPFSVIAQVTDMPCSSGLMYALEGSSVRKLQLSGSTITDLGIITSFTGQSGALAYGHDIFTGSTNRTLYSDRFNFVTNQHDMLQYNGSSWIVFNNDTTVYHNAGGYGNFIYFQHVKNNGMPNDQCISRLNTNGTFTKIYTDTSLVFSVSDIAVNSQGHIFCFVGTAIAFTTEIRELDQNGNIVNTWTTNLNNLGTLWGTCFIGNDLYVGWNTMNAQLFPVIFSGTSATLGTPVSFPSGQSYKDLASCHDSTESPTGLEYLTAEFQPAIFPNPSADGYFSIQSRQLIKEIIIRNIQGAVILKSEGTEASLPFKIDLPGAYIAEIRTDKIYIRKIIRN